MNIPALAEVTRRVRELRTRHEDSAYGRFLDRPYASVQLLLLAGAGLLGFGILMAVSTTIAASHESSGIGNGQIWDQVVKEAIFIGLGLPIFFFALCLPPRGYRLLVYPVLAFAILMLFAVLVPGIGVNINGAKRWIELGPLQLQPSEIAKFALLLWGGDLLARKQQLGTLEKARHLFVPLVPGFLIVAGLIMLEPDLGTTCCLVLILLGLLWMIGMPLRYFAAVLAVLVASVFALAYAAPYRWERMTTFIDPWKDPQNTGFHTIESLYALASGGWWGVGLGQGTSKYGWVPNANTDYVFAIIGEEMGLLGCAAVLFLFGFFAYTGMRVARRSADPFARVVAGAATVWMSGQALIQIGYVTGLLPSTGVPLPFISAGGTSLLVSFGVLGMLVSFARHEAPAVQAARRAAKRGERTRLERWMHVPVPRSYAPPKRRPAAVARERAARTAAGRTLATRPGLPGRPAAARTRTAGRPLRPTGTEGRR